MEYLYHRYLYKGQQNTWILEEKCNVKEAAYKGLLRPVLEYGSSVWNPHILANAFRRNWRRYRIVPLDLYLGITFKEVRMTGILDQLKWETLKKRRTDYRLKYKSLKGKARIPTDDLIPKARCCRNNHSMSFQIPPASIEAYICSFFPHLSGTGMTSLTICFPPLKCQIIMCP